MAPGNRRLPILGREAEDQRLPVVLLSGFLGSGKTTLVNAVLRDPRMANTAVAVNEFGSVPIDGDLIDHGADRTITMANGCLCCNLSGDMEDAVMRLFSRRQTGELPGFARLIVEPSGLSDPAPIAQAILRNPLMARALRLEAIVATVDAVFAASQLGRYPETRKQIASRRSDRHHQDRHRPRRRRGHPSGHAARHQPGGADPDRDEWRGRRGAAVSARLPGRSSRVNGRCCSLTTPIRAISIGLLRCRCARRSRWTGGRLRRGCAGSGSATRTPCCGSRQSCTSPALPNQSSCRAFTTSWTLPSPWTAGRAAIGDQLWY